jgi:hypothetical protein
MFRLLVLLILTGCGIQSTLPEDESPSQPSLEKAVLIQKVADTPTGVIIHCQLNSSLNNLLVNNLPVSIEFEGIVIEQKNFSNLNATVPFTKFLPANAGFIYCLVEIDGFIFESEPLWIEP